MPDGKDESAWYSLIDDVAFEWEQRTGLQLEFDEYREVFQKDVNNYIIIPSGPLHDEKGKPRWKSKGAYIFHGMDFLHPGICWIKGSENPNTLFFQAFIPVHDTIQETAESDCP